MTLSGLSVYPVKSARGVTLQNAIVGPRGLDGDWRWMVVDERRVFVSQRTHPRLALVAAAVEGGRLELAAPGLPGLVVDTPATGAPTVRVQVWDDVCNAQLAGPEAARWISALLGLTCELVFLPDASHRAVAPRAGPVRARDIRGEKASATPATP